jgi:hypothetical protein
VNPTAAKHKLDLGCSALFYADNYKMQTMNSRAFTKVTMIIVLSLTVLISNTSAQYKDFVRQDTKQEYFRISFDRSNLTISVPSADHPRTVTTAIAEIVISTTEVKLSNGLSFTPNGMNLNGATYSYDRIVESRISIENNSKHLVFLTDDKPPDDPGRLRLGNLFSFSDSIVIKSGDFVRGLVLSVLAPVTVEGEVNKDVFSLFGDISLGSNAVVRGDLASITGEIKIASQATIYGEIYSGKKEFDTKRLRFYQESELSAGLLLNYNRVDGLLLGGTLGFVHNDSAWPSLKAGVGYAMESERLRFNLRATQLISRNKSFSVGGELYQRLASEDDRVISNGENMAFALIATEDYKDYYETKGGSGWLELHPCRFSSIQTGYRYDDTRWLRAHRHLWSLFGGNKLFSENFGTVESSYRTVGITEINQTNNAAIFLEAVYDSRSDERTEKISGWAFSGMLEWSHPDLSSDFDYTRYLLTVVRYQPINRIHSFRWHGEYAGSNGYLPMYKRYFLGGPGTLWGYRNKEFMGARYWRSNLEYWVTLPTKFESNIALFWNVARISNSSGFDDNDEVRNEIGLGLILADVRFNLAKRLDSYSDRDPRFYLRFSKAF